jgi:hypothetical protein
VGDHLKDSLSTISRDSITSTTSPPLSPAFGWKSQRDNP